MGHRISLNGKVILLTIRHVLRALCREDSDAWPEISFSYFLQYVLHNQFKSVSDYARKNGVVLKGDLPIGVSRTSVEA